MEGSETVVMADMLFASKVRGAASALGRGVRIVSRPERVPAAIRESGTGLVLVDLELSGGRGPQAVRAIRSDPDLAGVNIVAFSSHTNTAAIEEGRAAGADRVLARSAFIQMLPRLLKGEV